MFSMFDLNVVLFPRLISINVISLLVVEYQKSLQSENDTELTVAFAKWVYNNDPEFKSHILVVLSVEPVTNDDVCKY